MPRLDTAIPTSISVTNPGTTPVYLPAGIQIPAGATRTITLTNYAARQPFGDPSPSLREQVWDAIVLAGRTTTARAAGVLTLGATVPVTLTPALGTAATDYTGERLDGVATGHIYGKGPADPTAHNGLNPYTTGRGVGAGVGPGAADNTIRSV
jgi:hypothetical protein